MAEDMTLEDVKKHVRVYIGVFIALAILTVVTVAVSLLDIPFYPALIVALLIASIKGSLVAAYFMHLISEKQVVMWVLIMAGVFLIAMFILFIFAYADQEGMALLSDLTGYVA